MYVTYDVAILVYYKIATKLQNRHHHISRRKHVEMMIDDESLHKPNICQKAIFLPLFKRLLKDMKDRSCSTHWCPQGSVWFQDSIQRVSIGKYSSDKCSQCFWKCLPHYICAEDLITAIDIGVKWSLLIAEGSPSLTDRGSGSVAETCPRTQRINICCKSKMQQQGKCSEVMDQGPLSFGPAQAAAV